ncbi:MAG TPA: hypothetical protein VI759_01505, partial [Dehalococcoidia bacterium]|nr:hypothetical protein [Dehalococcoidia bacterium]
PRREGEILVVDVGGPVTVVSFASLDLDSFFPRFAFRRSFATLGLNQIYVRDFDFSWYQRGLKYTRGGFEGALRLLQGQIDDLGAPAVAIGASMGGYASVLYGARLNLAGALAFSPQTVLDAETRAGMGDHRWPKAYAKLDSRAPRPFDLRQELAGSPLPVTLWCGQDDPLDVAHAEQIAGLANVRLHMLPAKHDVPHMLRDGGTLRDAILDFIIGLPGIDTDAVEALRARAPQALAAVLDD